MPDRELSWEMRHRLAATLNAGARLRAPLPSQARYAREADEMHFGPTVRTRVFALAGIAALVVALFAVAGAQAGLLEPVSKAVKHFGIPMLHPSGSSHQPSVGARSTMPTQAAKQQAGPPQSNAEPSDSSGSAEMPEAPQPPESGGPPASEPTQGPEPGDGGGGGGDHSAPSGTPPPDNG